MTRVSGLILLCSIVGSLAIAARQIHQDDVKPAPESLTIASGRQSTSNTDTTEIMVEGGSQESKLFGTCTKTGKSAVVTFREFQYSSGNLYYYYVPSDPTVKQNMVWSIVPEVATFKDCAAATDQSGGIIFKFEEGECSISSTTTPPAGPQKCDDRTAAGFYVTGTCTGPSESDLTFTPAPGRIEVHWNPQDSCSQIISYKMETYDGDSLVDTKNFSGGGTFWVHFSPGCTVLTVTVTAYDTYLNNLPYTVTKTVTTLSADALIQDVQLFATGLVTYEVTWTLDDPCDNVESFDLEYTWDNGGYKTATVTGEKRSATEILNGCGSLNVAITAMDAEGNIQHATNEDLSLASSCDVGFTEVCSGCLKTGPEKSRGDSQDFCFMKNSEADFLTVANADELDALRIVLRTHFPNADKSYWVDLRKISDVWTWGRTNYVQPEPFAADWITGQPNDKSCGHVDSTSFLLGDKQCDNSVDVKPLCYYLPDPQSDGSSGSSVISNPG